MSEVNGKNGYLALCYHYIRCARSLKQFSRILGNTTDEFHRHIRMLKSQYEIISLDSAYKFSYENFFLKNGKYGVLITFDDGLSDHYLAAGILAEFGISGVFFIPTCILKDKLPANPTIIHYCLAKYGIERFLYAYRGALEEHKLNIKRYNVKFKRGEYDPMKTISIIKSVFKYRLEKNTARNVLLHIYKNLFLKNYPEALKIMHLTEKQIRNMLDMGHFIGVHSHSHISVAATELPEKDFREEIIEPKRYLERIFRVPINAMSYPFGEKRDCLSSGILTRKTKEYRLAFTIEKIVNTKDTSPLELGRYMLTSTDNEIRLKEILETIIAEKRI